MSGLVDALSWLLLMTGSLFVITGGIGLVPWALTARMRS